MTTDDDIKILTEAADTLASRLGRVRRCNGCDRVLPITSFGILRSSPSGRRSRCRQCQADYMRCRRSTPAGKAENIASVRKSTARAMLRVGRVADAERIFPGISNV